MAFHPSDSLTFEDVRTKIWRCQGSASETLTSEEGKDFGSQEETHLAEIVEKSVKMSTKTIMGELVKQMAEANLMTAKIVANNISRPTQNPTARLLDDSRAIPHICAGTLSYTSTRTQELHTSDIANIAKNPDPDQKPHLANLLRELRGSSLKSLKSHDPQRQSGG
ncbi:hypothetical protein ACJZ2D_007976 [Fusarium nematophilum]